MGLKKEFEKAAKKVEKALTDPKNAVNMMYSTYALSKNVEKDHQQKKAASAAQAAAVQQAEINAAEQDFQNDLDRKRRGSKRTNVIFAGLSGNSDEIGLGGQKNLLGL